MTIAKFLKQSIQLLSSAGIGTARLDTLVLLEDVMGKDRAWLLAHDDAGIEPAQVEELEKLLTKRAQHVPLAYVRGHTEFYGRTFVITPAVLEPRPESETMIDLLTQTVIPALEPEPRQKKLHLADIGTGSGALGITAAIEVKNLAVDLLEVDKKAAEIAQINVDKLTSGIHVILSDLLAQTDRDYDILLCNLPYVPDDYQINTAALHEPRIAIFGGSDGLDLYRKLFKQLQKLKNRPLFILTESLPPQHNSLQAIAEAGGYQLRETNDFIQVFENPAV